MKPLHFLPLAIVVTCFSSCFSISEEIYLKEDGSGEYKMKILMDSTVDYSKYFDTTMIKDPSMKDLFGKLGGGGKLDSLQDVMEKEKLEYPFSSLSDLQDFKNKMFAKEKNEEDDDDESGFGDGGPGIAQMKVKYKLKRNVFTRSTKFSGVEKESKESKTEFMAMMFASSKLRTTVYLPKKVKEVKGGTIVSQEEKTVVLEYPLLDYLTGKTPDNFEIIME